MDAAQQFFVTKALLPYSGVGGAGNGQGNVGGAGAGNLGGIGG